MCQIWAKTYGKWVAVSICKSLGSAALIQRQSDVIQLANLPFENGDVAAKFGQIRSFGEQQVWMTYNLPSWKSFRLL